MPKRNCSKLTTNIAQKKLALTKNLWKKPGTETLVSMMPKLKPSCSACWNVLDWWPTTESSTETSPSPKLKMILKKMLVEPSTFAWRSLDLPMMRRHGTTSSVTTKKDQTTLSYKSIPIDVYMLPTQLIKILLNLSFKPISNFSNVIIICLSIKSTNRIINPFKWKMF